MHFTAQYRLFINLKKIGLNNSVPILIQRYKSKSWHDSANGAKYSRMDQVKFVEDSL